MLQIDRAYARTYTGILIRQTRAHLARIHMCVRIQNFPYNTCAPGTYSCVRPYTGIPIRDCRIIMGALLERESTVREKVCHGTRGLLLQQYYHYSNK